MGPGWNTSQKQQQLLLPPTPDDSPLQVAMDESAIEVVEALAWFAAANAVHRRNAIYIVATWSKPPTVRLYVPLCERHLALRSQEQLLVGLPEELALQCLGTILTMDGCH